MEQRNSRAAPVDYRAVIIAECVRGRLRSCGTYPSAMAKSTALNAGDFAVIDGRVPQARSLPRAHSAIITAR